MTHSKKVLTLIKVGNHDQAEQELDQALTKDPAENLFELAESLLELGFSNWARKIYQQLLEQFPEEDQLKTSLAEIAINNGQDDQALIYLSSVKASSPAYLTALLVAADLYQTQGLFEASEHKLLLAHKIAPTETAVNFGLAELYYDMKNYRSALSFYLDLLKTGQLVIAQVNLVQRVGACYAESGRFEQALGYLEQIHPEDLAPDSLFQLSFTQYELKHYEDAIKSFNKLKESVPDYTTLYPVLAAAYEQVGQLKEALLTAQEGLRVDQYNSNLYLQASRLALKMQQADLAEKYLRRALAFDEDNLQLITELSKLLQQQKRFSEEIDFLKKVNQTLSDPQLTLNLGRAYAAVEKDQAALECYQAVQTDLASNAAYWQELAPLARRAGNLNLAKQAVKKYLQIVPNDLEMLDLQAELTDDF
ncbi:tetratricopeptide repeat protein [Liquorilactobacillus nagelii]|uniref:tetratricopeptide repeat protein n=1 Tax=Liquorilactobacillus nagelii TaxID=82688 RepID=UPI001CCE594B|nr:tetratricopeptide repeat protein [Liquorilactobacillus nagelii]ULQ49486.1 tetratricopeptide repeat protein [Liquorilactobacillus nagelii]